MARFGASLIFHTVISFLGYKDYRRSAKNVAKQVFRVFRLVTLARCKGIAKQFPRSLLRLGCSNEFLVAAEL